MILLDEIEKAHPDVFNVLLQMLDDGRLTDGQGRTVDFRNTVVIMTSNLGSAEIQQLAARAGADLGKMREAALEHLRAAFRPEFLNRVDEVVIFQPLSREDVGRIVEIQLGRLRALLAERKLTAHALRGGARGHRRRRLRPGLRRPAAQAGAAAAGAGPAGLNGCCAASSSPATRSCSTRTRTGRCASGRGSGRRGRRWRADGAAGAWGGRFDRDQPRLSHFAQLGDPLPASVGPGEANQLTLLSQFSR